MTRDRRNSKSLLDNILLEEQDDSWNTSTSNMSSEGTGIQSSSLSSTSHRSSPTQVVSTSSESSPSTTSASTNASANTSTIATSPLLPKKLVLLQYQQDHKLSLRYGMHHHKSSSSPSYLEIKKILERDKTETMVSLSLVQSYLAQASKQYITRGGNKMSMKPFLNMGKNNTHKHLKPIPNNHNHNSTIGCNSSSDSSSSSMTTDHNSNSNNNCKQNRDSSSSSSSLDEKDHEATTTTTAAVTILVEDHDDMDDIEVALSKDEEDDDNNNNHNNIQSQGMIDNTIKDESSHEWNRIQKNVLLLLHRLCKGKNDSLLMLLLLLNGYTYTKSRIFEDESSSDTFTKTTTIKSGGRDNHTTFTEKDHHVAHAAAHDVIAILFMIEESYHTCLTIPSRSVDSTMDDQQQQSKLKDSTIISDLLPPCFIPLGDATTTFFHSCSTTLITSHGNDTPKVSRKEDISGDEESTTRKSSMNITSSSTSSSSSSSSMDNKISPALTAIGGILGKVRSVRKLSPPNNTSSNQGSSTTTTTSINTVSSAPTTKGPDLTNLFKRRGPIPPKSDEDPPSNDVEPDYEAIIDHDPLGMTVENILERTVVRTIQPGGPAMNAGIKVGSLILKIGNNETETMTHFEVIDELRRSQRPLKLKLRCIQKEQLRHAREEMGRLIRGCGFGSSELMPEDPSSSSTATQYDHGWRSKAKATLSVSSKPRYLQYLQDLWQVAYERLNHGKGHNNNMKGDESLFRCGVKLVWILTLLAVGLEKEKSRVHHDTESSLKRSIGSSHHSRKEGSEPAKSISKILHDYIRSHIEGRPPDLEAEDTKQNIELTTRRRKSKLPQPPQHIIDRQKNIHSTGIRRGSFNLGSNASTSNNTLIQIGDILHRTQTFLAEPHCPIAALLRGEVIALVCDVLEIDVDLVLAQEESASSMSGHAPSPINDLGSAGSLLKLIILHCTWMRTSLCTRTVPSEHHKSHAGNRFLAIVHRLSLSNSASARIVASSLGTVLWSHLEFPHQLQLRGVLTRALHDTEVIVRKATATVLHDIAELVFDPRVVPWLVLMCERVMTDPDPSLRSTAMNLTWHLAEHLPNAFFGDASKGSRSLRRLPSPSHPMYVDAYLLQCKLYPVATRLAEDSTPSVRLSVAAQCDRLANALGEHWFSVIIDLLQSLISDADESVRSTATLCVPRLIETVLISTSAVVGQKMSVNVLDSLLPVVIKLIKDASVDVRISLASASGELLNLLAAFATSTDHSDSITGSSSNQALSQCKTHIDEILVPLLQRLLLDSVPEVTSAALRAVTNASKGRVREPVLNNFRSVTDGLCNMERNDPVFVPVLSEHQVQRLLPTMADLANSSQWRVRQSAAEIVPSLLGCTNQTDVRSEIADICFKLMSDPVDEVRKTAAACLCEGGNTATPESRVNIEWIEKVVLPHLRSRCTSSDVKQRLLSLRMVEILALNYYKSSSFNKSRELLQLASVLSKDRIPNVRINAARILGNILLVLHGSELEYAIEILETQISQEYDRNGGGDQDVIYYSKNSLMQAQNKVNSQKSAGVFSRWLQNVDSII